jgi:hypothetical protein
LTHNGLSSVRWPRRQGRVDLHTAMVRVPLILAMSLAMGGLPAMAQSLSTPKLAAKVFLRALRIGNASAAKEAAICTADEVQLIDAMVELSLSRVRLKVAVDDAFGIGSGNKLFGPDTTDQLIDEAADIPDDATEASLPFNREMQMRLRREGRIWRVDLVELNQREKLNEQIPTLNTMASAGNAVARDVKSGKLKDLDEVRAAFAAYRRKATSQPASSPS